VLFQRLRAAVSIVVLALGALSGACAGRAPAPARPGPTLPPNAGLGRLSFPTSTRVAAAQDAFHTGMLLLHLFEYDDAARAFQRAETLDPSFAMAYWGEAMTHTHPIWDEQDVAAARAALARFAPDPAARLARTPTERERGFMHAIDELYGAGTKAERDRAYMRAMKDLAARFPDDDEVQLFYALSLFGVQAGVRDVPTYMQAAAIAERVLCRHPDHPGAAHYLIHGVDDPPHAPLGLDAARTLARIAPHSAHAQHMASHIFLMLGMWDEVVTANQASVAAAATMHGHGAAHTGHANAWLIYGYLAQGRPAKAHELLLGARKDSQASGTPAPLPGQLDPDETVVGSVVQMWARYLVETEDWRGDVADWTFNFGGSLVPYQTYAWVQGYRAARLGDVARAKRYLAQHDDLRAKLGAFLAAKAEPAPLDQMWMSRVTIMGLMLQAAIEEAEGHADPALALARQAADLEAAMPDSFGPPFVDLPSRELLARLQLARGDAAAAEETYRRQLRSTRRRPATLLGLYRAATAAGHADQAARARAELEAVWHDAEPGVKRQLRP